MEKILQRIQQIMYYELGPGPQILGMRHIINLQKGGTLLYCLYLMSIFNNKDNELINMIYTGMHGSYGLAWVFKDYTFGDQNFVKKGRLLNVMSLMLVLGLYWLIPYWRISHPINDKKPSQILIALLLFVIGLVLMMASDCQKYFTLKLRKGLISDGCFKFTRNPNYLGEIILYFSFAFICPNPLAWAILLFVWTSVFSVNIILKEYSYQKKIGFSSYKQRSHILLPQILPNKYLDYALYAFIVSLSYYQYQQNQI